jgi:molybdate transport system substrate-binding protein
MNKFFSYITKLLKLVAPKLPSLERTLSLSKGVGGGFLLLLSLGLQAQTVKVTAAADLRYAMDEIAQLYMRTNQGSKIEVVYGSSGNAYTQISNGAPFDVYFSADIMYPQKLKEAGLTIAEPKMYAIGRLVLWSSTLDVSKGMDILKTPKIKIATANPEHAPYGQRAVEALKHYKLYAQVEKQLRFGENISQAAQFCLTGNADAGLLALSLVLSPTMSNKGKYFLIPETAHRPLEQGFVLLKRAEGNKTAFDFCKFIETREARGIFEKYGFTLPK